MERSSFSINVLYFGGYFCLLAFLSMSSIIMKDPFTGLFFFLYAAGQALLEAALLAALGAWIFRTFGKIAFEFFIGATFLLALLHVCDFFMNRILDLSIWATIGFVLDESWTNLITMLEASGMSLWFWALFAVGLTLIPWIGIALYRRTAPYSLAVRPAWVAQTLFCVPAALLFWDFSSYRVIHPDQYTAFTRLLPWKTTFLHPGTTLLPIGKPLKQPLSEQDTLLAISKEVKPINHKPNIYLFVIESLREDFITESIAPHLAQFRNNHVHFDLALANACGTHLSWFSLFHSQFPYLWRHTQKTGWSNGSPTLLFLKQLGYKIHLYTSADLAYYGMEELLFGKEHKLLSSYHTFHYGASITAAESDQKAVEAVRRAAQIQTEGQLFIVFLDSTHFGYSWPKTQEPAFQPIVHEFALFNILQSKSMLEKIKNRYRSAIHHIDALFGRFWSDLPNKEEALIAITGDHGEEFFEHGNLFHNSHLVHEQTHVPIYLKLGKQTRSPQSRTIVTQMDIFPTLIDAITGAPVSFLEGASILQPCKWPFAVIARYNAGRTPQEFAIHNGRYKMVARFSDEKQLFHPQPLQIRSLSDLRDEPVYECKDCVQEWVSQEFAPALNRLFQ